MTEAEILELSFLANEAVSTLFSIFFGIVSAYIAGLYFFLRSAPIFIRLIAFALLTSGFIFLGASMSGIETRILGLIEAWGTLEKTVTGIKQLNNPVLPLPAHDILAVAGITLPTFDGNRIGI
ncbi:MAG: hypothetical protein RLZ98_365 [Pseudomonadota bacterium]|jgi:hypothetical protein